MKKIILFSLLSFTVFASLTTKAADSLEPKEEPVSKIVLTDDHGIEDGLENQTKAKLKTTSAAETSSEFEDEGDDEFSEDDDDFDFDEDDDEEFEDDEDYEDDLESE